jgi:hypothetical protein
LTNLDKDSILIGDFNLPEIRWDSDESGARGRPVLEAARDHQLDQMVNFATHIKGNVLDLVLVNCPEQILTVNGTGRLGKSDHEMITVEIMINEQKCQNENGPVILNWKRADYTGMREFLYNYRWSLGTDSSVNEDWNEFKSVMTCLVDNFIPVSKIRSKNNQSGSPQK